MEHFFSAPVLIAFGIAIFRIAPPLIFAATGELISERAGMLNIGLEGIMSVGAIVGFSVGVQTGNAYLGMAAGALAGLIFNMIYAYATVHLNADQIIVGSAMNIIGVALSTYIYSINFSSAGLLSAPQAGVLKMPLLHKIPLIGEVLFEQSFLGYLSIAIVIAVSIFLYKTRPGLSLRAVGEYPKAAETLGINVLQQKYLACALCGLFAGLGGAYLTTTYVRVFVEGVISGRGYIALAAVIFGKWKPFGVYGSCIAFAFLGALQMSFQSGNSAIPYQFLLAMPYVLTLVTLAFFMKRSSGPKACAKPYLRNQ